MFRLEYEHKRDVESRIKKLESSLSSLENDLKLVQKKEAEVKLAIEKASDEINQWKDEVKGMVLSHIEVQFSVVFNYSSEELNLYSRKLSEFILTFLCRSWCVMFSNYVIQ